MAAWLPRMPSVVGGDEGAAGLIQYLAVFILLLGFFILLNSMSRLETTKVGQVLESVEAAFSRLSDVEGRGTDRLRSGALAEASRAVRSLGDLIQMEIPVVKLEVSNDGRTLVLTMPASEILENVGGRFTVRADRTTLLHRTADVLQPRDGAVQVRVEGLLSNASIARRETTPSLVDGAGALARALVHHGAPAAALTVGLETGEPGQLRLLFGITVAGRPVALAEEPAP